MKGQKLRFNILPFYLTVRSKTLSFSTEKQKGLIPLHISETGESFFNKYFPKFEGELIYAHPNSNLEHGTKIKLHINKCRNFARHYYSWLLFHHFKKHASAVQENFISDTIVWIEDRENSTHNSKVYRKYSLKPFIRRFTDQGELMISFGGESEILNINVKDFLENHSSELLKKVLYNNTILEYKDIPDEALDHLDQVYPVLNRDIWKELEFPFPGFELHNKYKDYHQYIDEFANDYLLSDAFKHVLSFQTPEFLPVDDDLVSYADPDAVNLLFKNGEHVDKHPWRGMLKGPYKTVPKKKIQIFFILHQSEGREALTLYEHLLGHKYDGNYISLNQNNTLFKGLLKYAKIPFHLNDELTIRFTNKENPLPKIAEALAEMDINPELNYLAIYFSSTPLSGKSDEDDERYAQIKELLLDKGISSQAIRTANIRERTSDLKDFLPHISVAMLAKLGGKPWVLNTPPNDELIIGIGAYKNQNIGHTYIGAALSFDNTGELNEFDCYGEDEIIHLAGRIARTVREFKEKKGKVSRLVIHFYKEMSKADMDVVLKHFREIEKEIDIVIITVYKTEHKDYVAFDDNYHEKIPLSGTIVRLSKRDYLLFNNERYTRSEKIPQFVGFPFPVKLKISASDDTLLDDENEIKKLIEQVYQFSRIYWKATRQQSLPVTVKYPELIAQLFPYFQEDDIPAFGKQNLWFL